MGLDHPHTKAGVGEFGVAISGGVWVAIRVSCLTPISANQGALADLNIGSLKKERNESTKQV